MRSLKQDIVFVLAISAIAVVIALAWGSPFIDAGGAHAQNTDRLQQPMQRIPPKLKPHPGTASPSANR